MHKNSSIKYNIINGQFDFSDFFDTCDRYGRSKRLSVKEINMIQLMIEEIVVNHLLKHTGNIRFEITCPKDGKDVEILLDYEGDAYNLYTADEKNMLSRTIILCLTQRSVYSYDSMNHLSIVMQLGVGGEPVILEL